MGVHISRFEGRNTGLGPSVLEDSRRGLNGIPDGFEGPWPRQGDWRAARRTTFCRNVRQNIDRIDRTARSMEICRCFLRSVLSVIIARRHDLIDRQDKYRPRTEYVGAGV
jgi:hypothetical protein